MTEAPVNGNGKHTNNSNPFEPGVRNAHDIQFLEMTKNAFSNRMDYFQKLLDPRRDLDRECGYPSTYSVGPDLYRQLYDRDPIANRVVQLMPKECWQKTPRVYEDENSQNVTEFEEAWDNLSKQLAPEKSWYQDEEGSLVWEYLRRADEISGIGAFGVMLLGLDDGLDLRDPVEGAISDKYVRDRAGKKKTTTNGAPRLDPTKLSFPTPLPSEAVLNEMVENSLTPPPDKWTDGGSVKIKHIDQGAAQQFKVDPRFVRNQDGHTVLELLREGRIVTNEVKTGTQVVSGGTMGTDAQYIGVQLSQSQFPVEKPIGKDLEITFLRVFDEALVQIVQYEANIRNPRFGRPVMYRITFHDPREQHSGIGLPLASIYVHWTRIIHLADTGNGVSSEIFAAPRLRPVLNPVLDGRKISGAGAEGYWQSCFAGVVLSTHPQLGGEVTIQGETKNVIENYMNGLQRWLVLSGMGASTLAPTVVDPTPHVDGQIQRICIQLGCPKRVFMGSERGELASSQDDSSWNDRIAHRQNTYVTPRVICPFIDRLILLGVLPEPEGYSIEWPSLDSLGEKDKAAIFFQKVQAYAAAIGGNVESIFTPLDMMTKLDSMDEEEAQAIINTATKAREEEMAANPQGFGVDGKPLPPGAPPQVGPDGKPLPQPDPIELAKAQATGGKKPPFGGGGKPGFGGPPKPGGFPPKAGGGKPPFVKNEYEELTHNFELGACTECGITENWCNQYGGTTCKDGSPGAKANEAKAKGLKSTAKPAAKTSPKKSVVYKQPLKGEAKAAASKEKVGKAGQMAKEMMDKGSSPATSKELFDHLHTLTVKELKEVQKESGVSGIKGSTKQKLLDALHKSIEGKSPSKIDVEVRSFAKNVNRIRMKEEMSGTPWIDRVLKSLEPAGRHTDRDGITWDTGMKERFDKLQSGKITDGTLRTVLGGETFRHDYGSMTVDQFKSVLPHLKYDESGNRATTSGRLTPDVLRRSFADHRSAIGAQPKSQSRAAGPREVDTFRLLPALGRRPTKNAAEDHSFFSSEYLDQLVTVLGAAAGKKNAKLALRSIDEDDIAMMIAMQEGDDDSDEVTENVFCATGSGGGVDATCGKDTGGAGEKPKSILGGNMGEKHVIGGVEYEVTGGGFAKKSGPDKGRKPVVLTSKAGKLIVKFQDELQSPTGDKAPVKDKVKAPAPTKGKAASTEPAFDYDKLLPQGLKPATRDKMLQSGELQYTEKLAKAGDTKSWADDWYMEGIHPSDATLKSLASTLPKEPIKLYRAHYDKFGHSDLEAWTTDKKYAEDFMSEGRTLIEKTFDPSQVISVMANIPGRESDPEVVVAHGVYAARMQSLRSRTRNSSSNYDCSGLLEVIRNSWHYVENAHVFNEEGQDDEALLMDALTANDGSEWYQTLLQAALQETGGNVALAVKFADEFFAENPEGGDGEEEDDEDDYESDSGDYADLYGEDYDPTDNAEEGEGKWVTMGGTPVFIKDGEITKGPKELKAIVNDPKPSKPKAEGGNKAAREIIEGIFPGLKISDRPYKADAIDRALFAAGKAIGNVSKAALTKAGEKISKGFGKMRERYGTKGAIAIAAAMVVTFPIPGNIFGVIAAAEGIRKLTGNAEGSTDYAQMARDAIKMASKTYSTLGVDMPEVNVAKLAELIERKAEKGGDE
jgi:hypothetical protein